MRYRLLRISLPLALLFCFAGAASARVCPERASACERYWSSGGIIFVGRVTKITALRKFGGRAPTGNRSVDLKPQTIVRLVVEKSYKGQREKIEEVLALGSAVEAPFVFRRGERYLVYADYNFADRRATVDPCGRTIRFVDAKEDVSYLEGVSGRNPAAEIPGYKGEAVPHFQILQGRTISRPQPPYPAIALAARASGVVPVLVLIDETGAVVGAKALCGHPLLRTAAESAAALARFSPIELGGRPSKVTTVISYNFVIE